MNCKTVIKSLSPFADDRLEVDLAVQVSEHLKTCAGCRKEYERLVVLKRSLRSLGNVPTPEYLHHFLQMRLASQKQNKWKAQLREAFEYAWSRMRTTEGLWYVTRLAGMAVTFVLFVGITAAVTPMYFDLRSSAGDRLLASQELPQFRMVFLKNLGLIPPDAQRKPINPSEAKINDLYIVKFGQDASRNGNADDTFSVVASVDRKGVAKIQNVLEYSADSSLLNEFSDMISSARFRPASLNGRAVDSRMVFTFSKISVYD